MLAEKIEYRPRYTVIEPFKKRRRSYARLKQKIPGIGLIVVGCIFPFVADIEGLSATILFVMLGLFSFIPFED